MQPVIRRGQIYFVSLDPSFGRELAGFKLRPVIVVSIPKLHDNLGMLVVVPGTSLKEQKKSTYANEALVEPTPENGLGSTTVFQAIQMRAISTGRIVGPAKGTLSISDLDRVLAAIRFTLGIGVQ